MALLDSGASACFLDEEFAKRQKIPLVQKSKPVHIEVIDRQSLLSGSITHETKPIEIMFKDHSSCIIFNIIKIPSNPVILGLSWLKKHNPLIDWRLWKMTFVTKPPKRKPSRKPQKKNPYLLEQEHL